MNSICLSGICLRCNRQINVSCMNHLQYIRLDYRYSSFPMSKPILYCLNQCFHRLHAMSVGEMNFAKFNKQYC